MNAIQATTQNDLAWLATCYVLGELSAEQASEFEAQLASDVAACAAVAQVAKCQLAVAAAMDRGERSAILVPVHQEVSVATSRWAGLGMTALAASAVTAAGVALMVGTPGPNTIGLARPNGVERIVAAWARGEAVRNALAEDSEVPEVSDDDLDPPDWMLAALTAAERQDQRPDRLPEVRDN